MADVRHREVYWDHLAFLVFTVIVLFSVVWKARTTENPYGQAKRWSLNRGSRLKGLGHAISGNQLSFHFANYEL